MALNISFIKTMLEEKEISTETTVLKDSKHIGLTVQIVLDFIGKLPKEQVKQIALKFSEIDLRNGDVMHYLNYIAVGMVKALGY